jgi:hypothetical protein
VPPGCIGIERPETDGKAVVWLDGHEISFDAEGVVIFGPLVPTRRHVLTIRLGPGSELIAPLRFRTGATTWRLGNLIGCGLDNHSGSFLYQRAFEWKEKGAKEVLLDLGEVGLAARVWINDRSIADLPWPPYRADISSAIREGTNRLKVEVFNSQANAMAVGPWRYRLHNIARNGLHGPVRVLVTK